MGKQQKHNVNIKQLANGRWAVIRNGNKKPSFTVDTQKKAINKGSQLAKRHGIPMNIYNIEGNIRRTYKYSD